MVFHIAPLLAITAAKRVIKEAVHVSPCLECGEEQEKMWFGFKFVCVCKKCEDLGPWKVGNVALKVISLGVRSLALCLVPKDSY